LQVGKSGNSLRFGQPDFLSTRSLLRRLTARGPRTNAEGIPNPSFFATLTTLTTFFSYPKSFFSKSLWGIKNHLSLQRLSEEDKTFFPVYSGA